MEHKVTLGELRIIKVVFMHPEFMNKILYFIGKWNIA